MKLMTPKHPRWNEFIDILLGPRGCNVKTDDDDGLVWECEDDFSLAEAILESMGGFDVKASTDHLDGAYSAESDCGILEHLANERLSEWIEQRRKSLPRSPRSKD